MKHVPACGKCGIVAQFYHLPREMDGFGFGLGKKRLKVDEAGHAATVSRLTANFMVQTQSLYSIYPISFKAESIRPSFPKLGMYVLLD